MKTTTKNETLAEWYLRESWSELHGEEYALKRVAEFRERLANGQRIGQAFYNSTTPGDMAKLAQSLHDPFHFGMVETRAAIDWLCTKGS